MLHLQERFSALKLFLDEEITFCAGFMTTSEAEISFPFLHRFKAAKLIISKLAIVSSAGFRSD
jgi:hypothetical protein